MEKDLISVIVPCYNVEKYVSKCILSILNQSYKKIEVIAVNDGSTDNTKKILENLAKNDARVLIVNQNNGGLSFARNIGLKKSNGKYICFIDSDDYVDQNYIKELYKNMNDKKCDISCCDFYYTDIYDNVWTSKSKRINKDYTNKQALIDLFSGIQDLAVVTWNKLYKKSLFVDNKIEFPVGKTHEDNYTTYKLFFYANKVSFINKRLYYYLQRKDSIMGKKFNNSRLDIIECLNQTKDFVENKCDKEIMSFYISYEERTKTSLLSEMIKVKYDNNKIKKLQKSIKGKYFKYIFNNHLTIKEKFKLSIICLNIGLFRLIISKNKFVI